MKETANNFDPPLNSSGDATPTFDRNAWRWGFTPQAEVWNGRLAMLGFTFAILFELFTGRLKLFS